MNHKWFLITLVVSCVVLAGVAVTTAQEGDSLHPVGAQASPLEQVEGRLGTGFTYQGYLEDANSSVTNMCSFRFTLWDGKPNAGGTQVGTECVVGNVEVVDGYFTVLVNDGGEFGVDAFNGEARWLEIAVMCSGDTAWASLPVHMLTPAPYALALPGLWTQSNVTSTNLIGGYSGNSVGPGVIGSTIGGGGSSAWPNQVTISYATIGGGGGNVATGAYSFATIGGGWENTASGWASTISGGYENTTSSNPGTTISGGGNNTASGYHATIGGGQNNIANNQYTLVAGGIYNTTSGDYATIGGGWENTASGVGSTISGGQANAVTATHATVSGGYRNTASGEGATISGGSDNTASGDHAIVAGGYNNSASSYRATIGGGWENTASNYHAIVGGGTSNTASGYGAAIGGGRQNVASDYYVTIGGGEFNTAEKDGAAVAGGSYNTASGLNSTVSGGWRNTASGDSSTVPGGAQNTASGEHATVAGGFYNTVSGNYATVAGGSDNTAIGTASTIAGGADNTASGYISFAAGHYAHANHDGSYVWSSHESTSSWGNNTFTARAHGGARFYSASGTGTGVQLSSGGSSWGSISDRNAKENFADVDAEHVLEVLAAMPIQTWNLRSQPAGMRHIGPVAQDFNAGFAYLFGEVESPTHINNMDAIGVALISIQGLYAKNQALQTEVAALQEEVSILRTKEATQQEQIDDLERRMAALEGSGAAAGPAGIDLPATGWLGLGGLLVGLVWAVQRDRRPSLRKLAGMMRYQRF